jgi:hypothetical protein
MSDERQKLITDLERIKSGGRASWLTGDSPPLLETDKKTRRHRKPVQRKAPAGEVNMFESTTNFLTLKPLPVDDLQEAQQKAEAEAKNKKNQQSRQGGT